MELTATRPRFNDINVEKVDFETFWLHSRYRNLVPRVDLRRHVWNALNQIDDEGGFHVLLSSKENGKCTGTMAVFRDSSYRSHERDDVGCFGLVSAQDPESFAAMLGAGRDCMGIDSIDMFRGPINVPRSLLGQGVQVSGFDLPAIAGSSIDPYHYIMLYEYLVVNRDVDHFDRYYNMHQDIETMIPCIKTTNFDRDFTWINPDFNDPGDLLENGVNLMNNTLHYRPDYHLTSKEKLAGTVQSYRTLPGGEKFLGVLIDGDTVAGGVTMQPDWFQLLSGAPVTTIIDDLQMINSEYQSQDQLLHDKFSEYSASVLAERATKYHEQASIWERGLAKLSQVKNGHAPVAREYRVYEVRT